MPQKITCFYTRHELHVREVAELYMYSCTVPADAICYQRHGMQWLWSADQ